MLSVTSGSDSGSAATGSSVAGKRAIDDGVGGEDGVVDAAAQPRGVAREQAVDHGGIDREGIQQPAAPADERARRVIVDELAVDDHRTGAFAVHF